MASWVGTTLLDRYEIIDELAQGSMGQLYVARDRERGCIVALKRISKPEKERLRERFRREAQALELLRHPHIVQLYDYEAEHDPPFLIMQYVEGQNLTEWWAEREDTPLTLPEALRIVDPVGRALHYAHQRQIYHRDVKPANILLDIYSRPYLADFGVALLKDQDLPRLTTSGTSLGTPHYAAPEQIEGGETDARTDVYALGLVLYELLAGRPPFSARSYGRLVQQIVQEPPTPPRQINARISPAVEHVLLKALAKDKDQRYPSVASLLDAAWAAVPKQAVREQVQRKRRAVKSYLPLLLLLSVISNLLLILALFWLLGRESGLWASVAATGTPVVFAAATTSTATNTAAPTHTLTPTATPSPTTTETPDPTATSTATATSTIEPAFVAAEGPVPVYSGPSEQYTRLGELQSGERLPLLGRLQDGSWWLVDLHGQEGWVPAQAGGANVDPHSLPARSPPPAPTAVPPTSTPTAVATPTRVVQVATPAPEGTQMELRVRNAAFGGIDNAIIPGWHWWAEDDYRPGSDFDPENDYAPPIVARTYDPARMISGETLQIEVRRGLKFRAYVFQIVEVPPGAVLRFQVAAVAYSEGGSIKVSAGIDPEGRFGCEHALWGDILSINQISGEAYPTSPNVRAGPGGAVTLCIYAEPLYAGEAQAAFIDNAWLIQNPH